MNQFVFSRYRQRISFSFLAVAAWSNARRREREAYYRSETVQRRATAGERIEDVLAFVRELEKNSARQRREGLQLGGLITLAIGVGIMIFIRAVERADPYAYLVGIIPALVGIAILAHSYTLKNKAIGQEKPD